MQVLVEFTGISRVLTSLQERPLTLEEGATLQDVVRTLAREYPVLVGDVIQADGESLIATNLFSLNGKKILHENDTQFQPQDGDKLILLSLLAGG